MHPLLHVATLKIKVPLLLPVVLFIILIILYICVVVRFCSLRFVSNCQDFVGEWIPYCKRAEWADVKPIFLSENENAAVKIAHSEQFDETFAYFRAVLDLGEKSERVLQLTETAASFNPANYTVWQYRRVCLKELKVNLFHELDFIGRMIEENPKNYQVWHHRRVIVELLNDPANELAFTAAMFREDAKNYHAWQHRHWVVKNFRLWGEAELNYAAHLLSEDLRNNSAWNYRYFIINNTTGFTDEVINKELEIAMELIRKAPNNESAWNYISGLLIGKNLSDFPKLLDFAQELRADQSIRTSPYTLAFIIDYIDSSLDKNSTNKTENLQKAKEVLEELVNIDPIRKNYWTFLKDEMERKHA